MTCHTCIELQAKWSAAILRVMEVHKEMRGPHASHRAEEKLNAAEAEAQAAQQAFRTHQQQCHTTARTA